MVGQSRRRTLRRASSIPALALVSVTLLVAGVVFGLHVPGAAFLDPFPDVGQLDYSAGPPGGFAPLDPRFVHDLLGTTVAGPTGSGAGPGDLAPVSTAASPDDLGTPTLASPIQVTHAFINDDFRRAYRIPSIPFTARTSTVGASSEPGEQHCGPLSGRSAWYVFTAPRDVGLLADTFGTDAAMSLTVYTGARLADLRRVPDTECSSDARGNALVAFPAKAHTTYYFQVDGPVSADVVFTLQQQGVTKRASVGSHGEQGDGVSLFGILAHSGRQIVMASGASTFDDNPQPAKPCVRAAGDVGKGAPCGKIGMYLRDGVDRTTTNEYPSQNVDVAGTDKASLAIPGSMSADGRYLAFWATVQVPTPGVADERHSPYRFEVFRHDTKTGQNDRVSVAYKCDCDATDASSGRAEISADGRYVAFTSWASNIVPHDTNKVRDVFVRDMVTHVTTRVDVPSYRDRDLGEPNNAETKDKTRQDNENGDTGADLFSISRDGRYVVFKSSSSNLVRNDNNNVADVFVRDRVARTTIRVNVSSRGEQANHQTKSVLGLGLHTISDDGRYVFFNSNASNLVSPPTQDYLENVYRRDLRRGITTLVTVSSDGKRADSDVALDPERVAFTYLAPLLVAGGRDVGLSGLSYSATPDGRYIVFNSDATNLVPGDDNNVTDIFLRDLATRTTTRVSVTSGGEQTKAGHCGTPGLSDDARFVVFDCGAEAEDLVPEDTNKSGDVFVRELPGARPLTGWY